jgi:thiamine pyrophosphate-dependent acetolactate synthase large subunit-like protein
MMTNIEAVSDTLVAHGVDTLFGLIGNGNLDLIADLVGRKGVRYLGLRHENAVVAAADGFSRAGDRLGLATVTHGPGFTNALTALVTARRASSRLLLITGSAMGYTGRSTQKLDHSKVAHALGVAVIAPLPHDDWGEATRQALELATHGTVLLDLPAEATRFEAVRRESAPEARQASVQPERALIQQASELLGAAKRPLILAGRGAMRAGARDRLAALARRYGARLGTSLAAKGLFNGEPGDIGLVGGLGSPLSMAACRQCDVVLVAGASLNGFTTEHATLLKSAKVIRLDGNPQAPSSIPVHLSLAGDIVAALAAFDLEGDARSPWPIEAGPHNGPVRAWPVPVLERLDRLLPSGRAVVYDHGDQANAAVPFFGAHDATQSIFTPDFGALGLSVAAAIGAAVARPERRTLAVVGDGGMMMSLPDLDTLKRSGVPVTVVVFNDGVYGAEYPHLLEIGAPLAPATFASASIAGISRAVGLRSYRILEGEGFDVLDEAISGEGPALVEVMCAPPSQGSSAP